jgi:hypothetical protein
MFQNTNSLSSSPNINYLEQIIQPNLITKKTEGRLFTSAVGEYIILAGGGYLFDICDNFRKMII